MLQQERYYGNMFPVIHLVFVVAAAPFAFSRLAFKVARKSCPLAIAPAIPTLKRQSELFPPANAERRTLRSRASRRRRSPRARCGSLSGLVQLRFGSLRVSGSVNCVQFGLEDFCTGATISSRRLREGERAVRLTLLQRSGGSGGVKGGVKGAAWSLTALHGLL